MANVSLRLAADTDGYQCVIADPGPNHVVVVHVLMRGSFDQTGATSFRFAAPVPPNSGLTYFSQDSPYVIIGNPQSDVSVGLGTCESSNSLLIMTMYFVTSTGDPCTLYTIQPGGTYTDCTFSERPLGRGDGVALNSNGQCNPVPIRNPSPAEGAANVALTTLLSWDDAYYVCNAPLAASGTGIVYFGTTPKPPYDAGATATHTVGPLAPGTKYYWWVYGDYPYVASPVWSFTTTNSVAVKPSTWGAIKALYR